jgi:hypothetical protein
VDSPNRAYGNGMRKIAYLAVAIATALFGYLALFSIGFPFLLTGLLMLALTPLRRRIEIMVPALLWPWVFTLGYVLVAPLGCTRFVTPKIVGGVASVEGTTRCNALFFTYAGDGSYSPPIWPAVLVGAVFRDWDRCAGGADDDTAKDARLSALRSTPTNAGLKRTEACASGSSAEPSVPAPALRRTPDRGATVTGSYAALSSR